MFDSEDILIIRMDKLEKKINYFNSYYVYRAGVSIWLYNPGEPSTNINIDITKYADVINDIYNSVFDVISDFIDDVTADSNPNFPEGSDIWLVQEFAGVCRSFYVILVPSLVAREFRCRESKFQHFPCPSSKLLRSDWSRSLQEFTQP